MHLNFMAAGFLLIAFAPAAQAGVQLGGYRLNDGLYLKRAGCTVRSGSLASVEAAGPTYQSGGTHIVMIKMPMIYTLDPLACGDGPYLIEDSVLEKMSGKREVEIKDRTAEITSDRQMHPGDQVELAVKGVEVFPIGKPFGGCLFGEGKLTILSEDALNYQAVVRHPSGQSSRSSCKTGDLIYIAKSRIPGMERLRVIGRAVGKDGAGGEVFERDGQCFKSSHTTEVAFCYGAELPPEDEARIKSACPTLKAAYSLADTGKLDARELANTIPGISVTAYNLGINLSLVKYCTVPVPRKVDCLKKYRVACPASDGAQPSVEKPVGATPHEREVPSSEEEQIQTESGTSTELQ